MSMFTLRQLGYFVAVAEEGSISRAAVRLRLSESAVAASLTDLEASVGVQLCSRSRAAGVTLTPSGASLLERARPLLHDATLLHADLAGRPGELRGPVLIGCSRVIAPAVLPPVLDRSIERYPGIDVDFVLGRWDRILDRVQTGEIDFAILFGAHLPAGFRTVGLFEAPVHALLPADHRLAERESIDLRDLAHEPFVMLDAPPAATHALAMFESIGVRPMIRFRSPSLELTRSLVARGLGFSLQVTRPWGDRSHEGLPVVARPVHPRIEGDAVVAVWSERMRLGHRAEAVLQLARDVFAAAPASA